MRFFRQFAAPMVALLSGTLLVWTVIQLSGIGGSDGFSRPNTVGKVNGQTLDSREYERMVQEAAQRQQQQSPGTLGADDYAQIRDQVWNTWVDQAVLNAEYARRGITVSDEELADAIRTTPLPEIAQNANFQTDGRFDIGKYQRWLTSGGAAELLPFLEERYRGEMMRAKLLRVMSADVFISDAQLWESYRDQHEKVRVDVTAIIPRNAVPDSAVTVTPAEVEAYYRAHGDDFKRPEMAYLSYVSVPRVLNAADTAAALERARAARAEIVAGAKFEDVARRESQDAVSGARGGDLGEWTKGQMIPEFEAVTNRIPIGQISEPFLTQFGYHIVQVSKRTGDKTTARHILIHIELAGAHRDQVDAFADSLERLAADRVDPAALDTAARVLGLRVGRTLPVQRGSQAQAGAAVVPNVGSWAFQRAQAGAIGAIEETPDALYLFRIDSVVPEGIPPLDMIREAVEQEVRASKKWTNARAIAEQLQKRLDEGASLDMATRALALPHQILGPFTRVQPPMPVPAFIGTAFSLQPGQRSKVIDTPDGLYLVESVERIPADSAAFVAEKDQLMTQAIRLARQDRVRIYLAALRDKAKVVDRRAEVMRDAEAAQAAADAAGTTR